MVLRVRPTPYLRILYQVCDAQACVAGIKASIIHASVVCGRLILFGTTYHREPFWRQRRT